MIRGIGNDLIDITRVKAAVEHPKTGMRFIERILTAEERKLLNDRIGRKTEFVAGRFAAKEAVVKALGCGIGALIGFQDITILPDLHGRPCCQLSSKAQSQLNLTASDFLHISITHAKEYAAASAVWETRE